MDFAQIGRILQTLFLLTVLSSLILFSSWHYMFLSTGVGFSKNFIRVQDTPKWIKNETLDRIVKSYVKKSKELKPKPYLMVKLSKIANPCWRRASTLEVDCLPLFYFGGFAKCSTLDIWQRLLLHPHIFDTGKTVSDKNDAPLKEYNFWTRDLFQEKALLRDYMKNFNSLLNHTDSIVGDGTLGTFSDVLDARRTARLYPPGSEIRRALKNSEILPAHIIVQYVPHAKFLVMVREPAQRLYSHYLDSTTSDSDKRVEHEVQVTFHQLVLDEIETFKNCRMTKTAHACAYDDTVVLADRQTKVELHVGLYAYFIQDAMKLIPRENIAVFRSEDYVQNRTDVLSKIVRFLHLDSSEEILANMTDLRMDIFGEDDQLNTPFTEEASPSQKLPMWPETKKLLQEFYRPFNEELAKLLNDGRFLFDDLWNGLKPTKPPLHQYVFRPKRPV